MCAVKFDNDAKVIAATEEVPANLKNQVAGFLHLTSLAVKLDDEKDILGEV